MSSPKDYILYIDKDNKTQAAIALWLTDVRSDLENDGNKVIGVVSSGSEKDAIEYGDQVLR